MGLFRRKPSKVWKDLEKKARKADAQTVEILKSSFTTDEFQRFLLKWYATDKDRKDLGIEDVSIQRVDDNTVHVSLNGEKAASINSLFDDFNKLLIEEMEKHPENFTVTLTNNEE